VEEEPGEVKQFEDFSVIERLNIFTSGGMCVWSVEVCVYACLSIYMSLCMCV
jgi:hypothetical protein